MNLYIKRRIAKALLISALALAAIGTLIIYHAGYKYKAKGIQQDNQLFGN